MTALDFPNSPTVGQKFNGGGLTWMWNGTIWALASTDSMPAAGVSLGHSVAQTIPNAVGTAVTFDTEFYDTHGFHGTGTRITIPTGQSGRYLVGYTSSFFAVTGGVNRSGWIAKNGSVGDRIAHSLGYASASHAGQLTGTATLDLQAGDYIEHFVYQDSGAAQPLQGNNSAGHLLEFYVVRLDTGGGSGGGGGAGGGSGFTYTQESSPVGMVHGATWHDTSTGLSYVYVADGTSNQWVQFAPGITNLLPGGTTGQALVKKSGADQDVEWKDNSWNSARGLLTYSTEGTTLGNGVSSAETTIWVAPGASFVEGRRVKITCEGVYKANHPGEYFVFRIRRGATTAGAQIAYQSIHIQAGVLYHTPFHLIGYDSMLASLGSPNQWSFSVHRVSGAADGNLAVMGSAESWNLMSIEDVGPVTRI